VGSTHSETLRSGKSKILEEPCKTVVWKTMVWKNRGVEKPWCGKTVVWKNRGVEKPWFGKQSQGAHLINESNTATKQILPNFEQRTY
jgi:hypothetical protein